MTKSEKRERGVLTFHIDCDKTLAKIDFGKDVLNDLERAINDCKIADNFLGDLLQVDLNCLNIATKSQFVVDSFLDLRDELDLYAITRNKIKRETKRRGMQVSKLNTMNIIVIVVLICALFLSISISIGVGYMAIADLEDAIYHGIKIERSR